MTHYGLCGISKGVPKFRMMWLRRQLTMATAATSDTGGLDMRYA